MEREPHDYNYYMAQAKKYREMADNDDGYRRRILLGIVQDMEANARSLLRQSEQPGSNSE